MLTYNQSLLVKDPQSCRRDREAKQDPKIIFNTLRPRQDGRHFSDDIFNCIFLKENARISLKKSLKFVPKVRINNIPALVQIMAWRRSGDKPLSEPMVVCLVAQICVTRPQWVNFTFFSTQRPCVVVPYVPVASTYPIASPTPTGQAA